MSGRSAPFTSELFSLNASTYQMFLNTVGGNSFLCLFQTTNSDISLKVCYISGFSLSRILTSLVLLQTTFTCAFKPGYVMSCIWLHTLHCKA